MFLKLLSAVFMYLFSVFLKLMSRIGISSRATLKFRLLESSSYSGVVSTSVDFFIIFLRFCDASFCLVLPDVFKASFRDSVFLKLISRIGISLKGTVKFKTLESSYYSGVISTPGGLEWSGVLLMTYV